MSNDRKSDVMSKEDLLAKAKSIAIPIDFEVLVAEGILEKKGWVQNPRYEAPT